MRLSLLVAFLVAVGSLAAAEPTSPQPFTRGSWAKLRAEHAGQPTVIHFWGLTCGPCLVELPHWGKLVAARPDLRLVLVAADPLPQPGERVTATLSTAGLGAIESWSFTDRFYERLRYEIDPLWAGELPRTVLVGRDGSAKVLPGVADLDQVRVWLDQQKSTTR